MRSDIAEIQEHSTALRKEVGLTALVLTQIMYVVGTGWVGTAAKLGHGHTIFWLLAIALFFLPQAAVVIWLNRLMPLEGGLYQWAKLGFNDLTGFLTAWNLWVYAILILSAFGLIVARNLAPLVGAPPFTDTRAYAALVTVALIVGVALITVLGLRVGKWVQGIGGVAQLAAFAALIAAPAIALHRGVAIDAHPVEFVLPAMSLLSLNIFGKMAMGAFSGLEYVALMAGETKDPARSIARSVMISTPIIGAMFIFGTASVVALVPKSSIDLIAPVPQALLLGWTGTGAGGVVVMMVTVMLVIRLLANTSFVFAGNSRLPMVAGWDGLLPEWFTRLHPRWRTPRNAILFVAGVVLVFSGLGLVDAGQQEAFQLLDSAGGILYAVSYLVMFALPLIAPARLGVRPPVWLRAASFSGFVVTVVYCVMNAFPIIDVPNPLGFTVKIVSVILLANLVGVGLYFSSRQRGS